MNSRMMRKSGLLLGAVLLCAGFTAESRADNTCLDYSSTSNPAPTGNWSYGWTPNLTGSAFSLYTFYVNSDAFGNELWQDVTGQYNTFHNDTAIAHGGPISLDPGECGFHPGPNAEYSIYRWTAPALGLAAISATFSGDTGSATTQVAVVHNNSVLLFSDFLNLNGRPNQATMAQSISVLAGDWIDFKVWHGGNGYFDDATQIDGTVTLEEPTPTASTSWGGVKAIYR